MTGNDMLATLGLRLNDPDSVKFPQSSRLDALNIAQKSVVNLVNNAYLTELQVIDAAKAMTANALAFSSLANVPIRNGIIAVKDATGGKWANMIDPGDQKRLENTYLAASSINPIAYIFNEKIYVEGPGATDTIDVWYLKEPTDLAASATECELNVSLHQLVVDFAEAQLWKMANNLDQANGAQKNAYDQIQALNARYEAEKPRGIGV